MIKLDNFIFGTLFFSLCTFAHTATPDQLREQAVIQARQGQVTEGLFQLEKLVQRYPTDQKILADYFILAAQAKQLTVEKTTLLQHIQVDHFPEYAQLPVLKALRDLKLFPQALQLLQQFEPYQTQNKATFKVLKAVLLAESKQVKPALDVLKNIQVTELVAGLNLQVAYVYRTLGQPMDALTSIQYAYTQAPQNKEVQQEYIHSLMALGAYQRADRFIQQHQLQDWSAPLQTQIDLGGFSQQINTAIKRQQYLSARGENEAVSFTLLDDVLKKAEQDIQPATLQAPYFNRFYYDYIYALSYRGRSDFFFDIVKTVNTLPDVLKMPAYARQAVADAYLKERQPAQAERIYQSLLIEKNYADMSVYSSLYYALIEQEKYDQANQLIQQIDHLLPTYQYSQAKGVDKAVHADRTQYIGLRGLNWAYSNRLDLAEPYFEGLVDKTSNTDEGLNQLSRIQRWRDQPEKAAATLARLNGFQPVSKQTRINSMQNAQALGDILAWRQTTTQLLQDYPKDGSVVKSRKELDDRDRASIQHSSRFSRSHSDQENVLQNLKGSKDRELNTTIYSPWLADQYRMFVEHRDIWGKYRQGDLQQQRFGVGVQWQDQRKALTVTASQNQQGERQGVEAEWTHQLNDHWQYAVNANSQADIPLQAVELNHDGYSYDLGLRRKQNESRQAGMAYNATDISDGNLRQELSADYSQRIFQRAHHTTTAGLNAYYAQNSRDNVSYFSPKESYSVGFSLGHDWLTWWDYERALTQRFSLGVAAYHQQKYDTKPIVDLQYQHQWKLSRTWALRYGVGYGVHAYDGEYEKQVYGNLGFEGRF